MSRGEKTHSHSHTHPGDTGESGVSPSTPAQGGQPTPGSPGALCSNGCGRPATKASGYLWAWHCDPTVSTEEKQKALQLGGRRGAMTPTEVGRLLEGADLDTREGRQQLRDRFLRLRLAGRIGAGVYQDVLRALDGAAKDQERTPTGKAQPAPVIVEVARFGQNGAPA
jgi:hypothetical protein